MTLKGKLIDNCFGDIMSILKCPVCNQALNKIDKQYVCINKHSYDISKKGYANLILANQGHSLIEGDKKDMVDARSRFLDSNKYKVLLDALIKIVNDFAKDNSTICDIACGEGYYTNSIHKKLKDTKHIKTVGIDISKFAINHSCTRKNIDKLTDIDYFIGNMDYLPFLDNSFSLLINCFAPINEKEFYRVLEKGGYYIRVLPGIYHLYELKAFLYNEVHLNVPKEENLEGFSLVKEETVSSLIQLNNQELLDLFTMTPYYYKTSLEAKERLKECQSLDTKIEFTIRIYKKDSK